tara:strand:+ start:218 stop:556 length:339 start_codon:yes stop_codon:yes gene_type:complete
MVDLNRRKFIKLGLRLVSTGTALAATYPIVSLYQDKVQPTLEEKFPEREIPDHIDFSNLDYLTPQILSSTAVMTFIMMYADSLQTILTILVSALALIFLGIPLTEFTLGYFI